MTKTIKIPAAVHQELKRYVANTPNEKIEDVAGYSIMLYLKEQGHKFLPKKKSIQVTNK